MEIVSMSENLGRIDSRLVLVVRVFFYFATAFANRCTNLRFFLTLERTWMVERNIRPSQ